MFADLQIRSSGNRNLRKLLMTGVAFFKSKCKNLIAASMYYMDKNTRKKKGMLCAYPFQ